MIRALRSTDKEKYVRIDPLDEVRWTLQASTELISMVNK
jgi:hypothetical protein